MSLKTFHNHEFEQGSGRLQFDVTVVCSGTWKQLGQPPIRPPSALGYSLKLRSEFNCSITVRAKCPVAYTPYQAVDEELDCLERMKTIDHSNWAAPIIVVRKASG